MMRADMVQRVLANPPSDRRCSSGHPVPEDAVFQGEPTRFIKVSSKEINGTFCEPCLVVANFLARSKRYGNG